MYAKLVVILSSVFTLLFFSCGENKEEVTTEVVLEKPVSEVDEVKNETYYQIPSPEEMFSFVKQGGLGYNTNLLSLTKNVSNYTDPKSQALNFGIYSADLAYTAAYEEYQESMKYFIVIEKLAEQIHISSVFDGNLLERVKKNLDSPDSLLAITNASYYATIESLERNEQQAKLGIIAFAGWLETIYIVTNTVEYSNTEVLDRLAGQKLTIENLVGYLEKYASTSNDVKEVLSQLKEIETIFNELPEEESTSTTLKKKQGGKLVLKGGTKIDMTKESFEKIKNKVIEIRSNIIQANV